MRKAVIIGIAAILLTACGGSDSAASESPAPQETTTTAAAETETAPAASADEKAAEPAETTTAAETTAAEEVTTEAITQAGNVEINISKKEESEKVEITEDDISKISVKEYVYEGTKSTYDFIIITNNSSKAIKYSPSGIAKDSAGNTIGEAHVNLYGETIIAPGDTSIAFIDFSDVLGVASVELTPNYSIPEYNAVDLKKLNAKIDLDMDTRRGTIEVTNNGDVPVYYPKGCLLFIDDKGKPVDYDSSTYTNEGGSLQPGETVSHNFTMFREPDEFDHVEFYLSGHEK